MGYFPVKSKPISAVSIVLSIIIEIPEKVPTLIVSWRKKKLLRFSHVQQRQI